MTTAQNTNFSKKGFTLIELLIVIAIIAVLAIMGFAAFRGFTGRGNDARREADIKAIGDALEVTRQTPVGGVTPTAYAPLAASQFASGTIPTDPDTGRLAQYCIASSATNPPPALPANPTTPQWTSNGVGGGIACPAGAAGTLSVDYAPVAAGLPAVNTTLWKVCAIMGNNATIICRNSAQ